MEDVMRFTRVLTLIGVTLLSGFISRPLTAQTTFGAITGTVRDSSGAVIPKVTVEVIHLNSNYRYTTQSNEAGNYTLPQLREGEYRLSAKATGYKEFIANNIQLLARDERRIDLVLEVGGITDAVQVTAGATLIETDTPRISDTKDANQLKNLPLNTRSLYSFLALSPGVVGAGGGESFRRYAGSRRNQSDQAIDGISVSTGQDGTQITPLVQFIESFQEVRVDMSNNTADMGSVGQVTLVSKSGTNQLHGSLFDYYGTPSFRARNSFTGDRDPSVSHNPGGSIGGPIYIPKLYNGRDKSFFFFSFETSRGSQSLDSLEPTVPLESWRNGNFGNIRIRDPRRPLTEACNATDQTACFDDNTIPQDRINEVSRRIQERFYPLPNFGNTAAFAIRNFRTELTRPFDPNTYLTTRLDHRFSERAFIFGRYTWNRSFNRAYETELPTIGRLNRFRNTRASAISFTYTISPTLVSETRWGLSYSNDPRQGPIQGQEIVDFLGLQGLAPDLPDIGGVPRIMFTGLGITTVTQTAFRNPGFKNLTNQWQEHINYYNGRHSIKGGFQIGRYQSVDLQQNDNLFGSLTFSSRHTGHPYADFLLGLPTTVARAFPALEGDRRRWGYDFFVTDDFKVSQRLTLNLGLRYELRPYWTEANGLFAVFDIDRGKVVVPDGSLSKVSPLMPRNYVDIIEAKDAGLPGRSLIRADKNNFAPRIGFALRPTRGNDTVIRGGFGLFYDVVPRPLSAGGSPYVINEPNYSNAANPGGDPIVVLPNIFSASGVAGPTSIGLPQAVNPDLKIAYSMQYNLTVEHQKWNTGFRLSYIGTNTRQGDFTLNINQPVPDTTLYRAKPRRFPNYPGINYRTNGAGHQYHSLTAEVERRLVKGLAYQASWTWARDIGDLTGFENDADVGEMSENAYDRRRERGVVLDIPRHRVSGNVVYELPFGSGRKFFSGARRGINSILGGWDTSVIFSYYSGQFLTPTWEGPDPTGTRHTTGGIPVVNLRPDILHNPNLPASERTADRWFDTSAFGRPQPGRFGTSANGVIVGPPATVFHAGISKMFNFTESMRLRFELTATNVLNHTNFANPELDLSDLTSFGKISNSVIEGNIDQSAARSLRAGIRFEW
jgi:Carboxypeptidase regulatory-like domain